jgi:hypothetical protein
MKTTNVGIMDTYVKTSISEQGFEVLNTKEKIPNNIYEPKVVLEEKVPYCHVDIIFHPFIKI